MKKIISKSNGIVYLIQHLRNKSWKPECALSFNMGWRLNYFDSDMSNITNTVVYFDWKMVIYIYAWGQCHTQFMLPNLSRR